MPDSNTIELVFGIAAAIVVGGALGKLYKDRVTSRDSQRGNFSPFLKRLLRFEFK